MAEGMAAFKMAKDVWLKGLPTEEFTDSCFPGLYRYADMVFYDCPNSGTGNGICSV